MVRWTLPLVLLAAPAVFVFADTAPERGRKELLGRAFNSAPWSFSAYDKAWQKWQPTPAKAPSDYDEAFRAHYGLHAAPYANGRYPMGLRSGPGLLGKGLTTDCLLCHGSSILGQSYVGLGNASVDVQSLFEDMAKASGLPGRLPFKFCTTRGTSEAGSMAVYLLSFRQPDLGLRLAQHSFAIHDTLCEDVPAWWLLRKKKTMYHTGTSDARSVRSMMQFMLASTNTQSTFAREEPTFADIRAFIHTLEAPKFPFPIDARLADKGLALFKTHCARCHGSYGADESYPNKIVPLAVIGTDRTRAEGIDRAAGELYNRSWFAREVGDGYKVAEPTGYQAPPLDGIWATAPYFHNGSVPTLHDVLDSRGRPRIFTRSFRTSAEDYDHVKIGWKVQVLEAAPSTDLPGHERRKVYDTTQPGRGNAGHTFGDDLTEDQRRAVVEYLKTL